MCEVRDGREMGQETGDTVEETNERRVRAERGADEKRAAGACKPVAFGLGAVEAERRSVLVHLFVG